MEDEKKNKQIEVQDKKIENNEKNEKKGDEKVQEMKDTVNEGKK